MRFGKRGTQRREGPQACPAQAGDHVSRLSPGDHCQQRCSARAPSQRRRRAERLFAFSLLNLSGLILIHIGESVLSQLAFVPGEKKYLKKKKEETNIL